MLRGIISRSGTSPAVTNTNYSPREKLLDVDFLRTMATNQKKKPKRDPCKSIPHPPPHIWSKSTKEVKNVDRQDNDGENGTMGVNRTAAECGVPRTTLKDRIACWVVHCTNI